MSNPSFPVVTLAIWNSKPDDLITAQLSAKAAEMAVQGKTDDEPEQDPNALTHTRRNWLNTAAANEWITFVEGLGGPLASITIES